MSKLVEKIRDLLSLRQDDQAQRLLERWTKELVDNSPREFNELDWPYERLAILYRRKKEYHKEIEVLTVLVNAIGPTPVSQHQEDLIERLRRAQELAVRAVPERGNCEMCDNLDRVLTRIDSGHLVCKTCLRQFLPPPRKKHLATVKHIAYLRGVGFTVPDDLTRIEAKRLGRISLARSWGSDVDTTATDAEIEAELDKIVYTFDSRVSGVVHENDDGTSRQVAIGRCVVGEEVVLIRDPENPYDRNAVRVYRLHGNQIGYLPAVVAGNLGSFESNVAARMDQGIEFSAKIIEIALFNYKRCWFQGVDLRISYHPFKGMK